jgi:hypothetical protein
MIKTSKQKHPVANKHESERSSRPSDESVLNYTRRDGSYVLIEGF